MNHVTIQFPAIHNALETTKDLPLESAYRYVNVLKNHAVLVTSSTVICIDLREYFLNYCQINDEERQFFDELMAWMEGKSFPHDFWKFLTSKSEINVVNENRIRVKSGSFEKVLIYDHPGVNLDNIIELLQQNISNQKNSIPTVGISQHNFNVISKTIGKMIGKSALIFEFITISSTIRFAVDDMTFIFGIIFSSGQATLKQYNFEPYKKFVEPTLL